MTKTVVILGGSYAGVHIAHHLLKTTRRAEKDLRVVLVSKNSHFYWNLASMRAVIPGVIADGQIAQPLEKAFERYPGEAFELIVGTAEKLDTDAKTVTVAVAAPSAAGGERSLAYDQLVLATGSRCASPGVPWKADGTYEELAATLHATADKIQAAKSIVIAGAGATGIELAGEIGFQYGRDKEVTLLCSGQEVLGGDSLAPRAVSELSKLHVKVRTDAAVKGITALDDGRTGIELEGDAGDKLVVDLYLPTMGLVPNSEYIDRKFLNESGYAVVDEFFRLKGAEGVWAAGDIVSVPRASFLHTQKQAAGVAKNIDAAFQGRYPSAVKAFPIDVIICATGRSRAVGRLSSIPMFSAMAWMINGRTLGLEQLPSYIDGSVA